MSCFLCFLAFVTCGVVLMVRGSGTNAPFRVGAALFFIIVASITPAWVIAIKVAHVVFGIVVIGWSPYVTNLVHITEAQHRAVFLSDGRVIRGGQADIYQLAGGVSFLISGATFFCVLVKLTSWVAPSTGAELARLLNEKKSS